MQKQKIMNIHCYRLTSHAHATLFDVVETRNNLTQIFKTTQQSSFIHKSLRCDFLPSRRWVELIFYKNPNKVELSHNRNHIMMKERRKVYKSKDSNER